MFGLYLKTYLGGIIMKEKLGNTLGSVGIIVWYIFSFIFCFAPLIYLELPIIVKVLAVLAILCLPLLGEVVRCILYIWAFFAVISGPIGALSILFFVCFAIYIFVFGLPLIQSLLAFFKSSNPD